MYSSPNIIRVIKSRRLKWAGHIESMGASKGAYEILVGKPDVRKALGRQTHRLDNIIKMDLREVELGHRLDRSGSGQGQVADSF